MIAFLEFFTDYKSTFTFGLIYGLFALSTYASLASGVLSVAAASFGAVGGFTYARIRLDHDLGLGLGLLIGIGVGMATAIILSFVLLRLASHYVAMATIALVLITRVFIVNLPDLTGGANGISVPRQSSLWSVLAVTAVSLFIFWRLANSRYGMAAVTVREDPQAASTLGVDPRHVQRIGLLLSGGIGGVAGVLMADQLQFIGPNTFYIDLAFTMLAAVVLGGAYHWFGAIVGAMVFRFLPELLSEFIDDGHEIANGILLVIIMIYLPRGIVDPRRRKQRERPLWPPSRRSSSGPAIDEQPEAVLS
ncbi:MAG: branched-chain amino acid ABC transporter permease [Ilumatobacteraceae bacterium]|nr:branched-chain amino acid ABC transporter permease [Ilumatobacteraceae bacterium]